MRAATAREEADKAKNNAKASLDVLIKDYSENENSLKAMADQAIENIRNSKCLSESEFNSSFKTCQTAIDRYFSENHNILTGISSEARISSEAIKLESDIKINPTQTNGTISGNKIYVEEYLVNIVNNYISKVKSDKTAITGIFYTLIGCLGIFGVLYFVNKFGGNNV